MDINEVNPNSVLPASFDATNPNWEPASEYNEVFLRSQQQWLRQLLTKRDHLFLNEVYDALGLDRTPEGALLGWISDKPGEYQPIFTFEMTEPTAIIEFHPEGLIWDRI